MALRDEEADILGGPILQKPESGVFATFSQYHLVFNSATLLGLGLLVWIACARGLEHLKKHRELRYRKAMRRKHGIPDSDCRPFAVAYAAAKRAHLEREAQDRKKATNYVSDHNLPVVDQTDAQKDACPLRRRVPETIVQLQDYPLTGKPAERPEVYSLGFADRYNPGSHRRVYTPEPLPVERHFVRPASRREPIINLDDNGESRKRSFEDESDLQHEAVKKSRMDGDALTDGDEHADWYAQYADRSSRRASGESPNRQSEGNYVHMNGQERSKRVNGLYDEDHEPDEAMEDIDEDEVTDLKAVARGKKRDRTEAGSTFGGDDEEDIRNGRASHHRKRRTIPRRTDMPTRGQKRDREVESPESEGEGAGPETSTSRRRVQCGSKKKKIRKAATDEVSEILMEDPRVSEDALCDGLRVGEGWEADGVQYKVGDKGERLRLTLVKRARSRYHMPRDSQHPDRSAPPEIYVETWMTDEQYKQAEVRQELAWQGASRESSGSKTPDVLDSPAKNGKSLLWDSVKCSPTRPCRQFMASGVSTRINPFEQWQSQPILGRRVTSSSTIVSPILPGVADSPTRPGFRGFSKWEKQDREAEALARIRAKIEQQKKAQSPSQKAVEMPTSATAPELGARPMSVPTITLTPAPAVTAERKPGDSAPQCKPDSSTFSFATPPSTSDSIEDAAASVSTTAPGFSLSSSPAATASTLFPGAPIVSATTSSTGTLSPFSFEKPPQVPSSISTAPPSAMPNVFSKGTAATTPPSSAPSPSTLGATTQPQPSSIKNASHPVPFSFAKSDVSSSTLSPVVAPATDRFQAPISNATSSSLGNPPPVTFGSSPVVNKTELPVPPPISASENMKATAAPLFSFSGASSSSPATTHPTSSASLVPKFSFGQASTTSAFAPGSNLASSTASQPKPTFKFGQTSSAAAISASTAPSVADSKKSPMPMSVFGGSNEPAKVSPFGTPAFGSSTFSLHPASATNPLGKPAAMNNGPTPKPMLVPASADSTISSAPAGGVPLSSNPPVFSFGGANSASKSAEGSKPASLLGGVLGGSHPVAMFGRNFTEGKPTFGASASGPKPTSIFGSNIDGSKPSAFALGEAPKPASVFGGGVEAKSAFTFGGVAENKTISSPATEGSQPTFATHASSKPSNTTDSSKPAPTSGSVSFDPLSSASPFGKDGAATNTSTSTSMQTKPLVSFTFGAPSGMSPMFGQPSDATTSGDSTQTVFGKPANTMPSVFEFAKTGGSSPPNTVTFGKPAAQNQKQEQ